MDLWLGLRVADLGAQTATGGVVGYTVVADTDQYRLLDGQHRLAGRRLARLAWDGARIHRDPRDA